MDYEKAYKEAFEKAKMSYHTGDYDKDTLEMLEIIFPELAESEDERIRKAIIKYLDALDDDEIRYGVSFKDMRAWLEKQKPVEYTKGEDYGIDGLWHAIRILEQTLGTVEGYQSDDGILEHQCAITAVKELYKQKPVEWSEEDDKTLKRVIKSICISRNSCEEDDDIKDMYDEELDWLNHLKDRCLPQPKQEWNEEDKNLCNDSCGFLENEIPFVNDEHKKRIKQCVSWLISLKPRWKPSEEQMESLMDSIQSLYACKEKNLLLDLYEQLQKL